MLQIVIWQSDFKTEIIIASVENYNLELSNCWRCCSSLKRVKYIVKPIDESTKPDKKWGKSVLRYVVFINTKKKTSRNGYILNVLYLFNYLFNNMKQIPGTVMLNLLIRVESYLYIGIYIYVFECIWYMFNTTPYSILKSK